MGDQREEKTAGQRLFFRRGKTKMSNTLNHTSSRQIVRHYTHSQKRCKHLMQYFVSANGLFELKVKIYAFFIFYDSGGEVSFGINNCRHFLLFFFFHFHAIRNAFYSIHPTYRAEGEKRTANTIAYSSGIRAITLISKSKPASQVTPTAVQFG